MPDQPDELESSTPPSDPPLAAAPPTSRTAAAAQGAQEDVHGVAAPMVIAVLAMLLPIPVASLVVSVIAWRMARIPAAACAAEPTRYRNAGAARAGVVVSLVSIAVNAISTAVTILYAVVIVVLLVVFA